MAYNILGITPGHNGSATLVSEGKVVFYLEEERLSRIKYDGNPLRTILYILSKYKINELVITGAHSSYIPYVPPPPESQDVYSHLIKKYQNYLITIPFWENHHLSHASNAFYNSGFKSSSVLVVDAVGSTHKFKNKDKVIDIEETESIFSFNYPNIVKTHYKSYNNHSEFDYEDDVLNIKSSPGITKTYESITFLFGWGPMEGGKTMGLSSYGNLNKDLPLLFTQNKGNPDIFKSILGRGAVNNFKLPIPPEDWHYKPHKISQIEKDLAYHIQYEAEKEIFKLVEKTLDLTKLNKIACAGGFFLNCVCNYKLIKRFPNVDFYFEPTSHDGGNSLGAAMYRWYEYSQDTKIRPRKTLYQGPQYTKTQILEGIKKYI